MAIVIDATVGGASANSFVTLVQAQAYMSARLNSGAWDNATPDQQNRSLVSATQELSMLDWASRRATTTQALSWPRWFVQNPDAANFAVNYYLSTIIPDRVMNATCELAFQFLVGGTTDIASLDPSLGVIEQDVDVIHVRIQPYQKPMGLKRFPSVWRYIWPMLAGTSFQSELVRG